MICFLPHPENFTAPVASPNAASNALFPHRTMSPYLPAALLASSLLMGCSFDNVASAVNPYRIDVRQGNYVDQEMISRLRRGMTRDQVRFVLGSPLVVDLFRTDRWDYVYRYRPGSGAAEQRVISVFFVDDLLDHVEGDVQAAGASGEGAEDGVPGSARSRVVEVPAPAGKK